MMGKNESFLGREDGNSAVYKKLHDITENF
jgi:hypothetical protein